MEGPSRMQTRQMRKLRTNHFQIATVTRDKGGFTDTRYALRAVLAGNWTCSVTAASQLNGCLK